MALGLIPATVVTATSTAPTRVLAGAVATISSSASTLKLSAGLPPKLTALAPLRSEPVIVTWVPPFTDPRWGLIPSARSRARRSGLVRSTASRSPARIGRLVLKVCSPGSSGVTGLLVATPV
ncbi:MAG: hypothetical protein R2725_15765 [Solirubrobacterales bacterium]